MMADLSHMQQASLVSKLIFVPKVVLENVWNLAKLATDVPIHFCWPHMVSYAFPSFLVFKKKKKKKNLKNNIFNARKFTVK